MLHGSRIHWSAWLYGPAEVAKTAVKPSSALLQKHSLDGCTVDMPAVLTSAGGVVHIVRRCDDVDLLVISYNGTPRPFAKYCGSKVPPVTMSTDHAAELLFFSLPSSSSSVTTASPYWQPESSSAVGFRAQFAFVSGKNEKKEPTD